LYAKLIRFELFEYNANWDPAIRLESILSSMKRLQHLSLYGSGLGLHIIPSALPLKTINLTLPTKQYGYSVPCFDGSEDVCVTLLLNSLCSHIDFPCNTYDQIQLFSSEPLQSFPVLLTFPEGGRVLEVRSNMHTTPEVIIERRGSFESDNRFVYTFTESMPSFVYKQPHDEEYVHFLDELRFEWMKTENRGIKHLYPDREESMYYTNASIHPLNVQRFTLAQETHNDGFRSLNNPRMWNVGFHAIGSKYHNGCTIRVPDARENQGPTLHIQPPILKLVQSIVGVVEVEPHFLQHSFESEGLKGAACPFTSSSSQADMSESSHWESVISVEGNKHLVYIVLKTLSRRITDLLQKRFPGVVSDVQIQENRMHVIYSVSSDPALITIFGAIIYMCLSVVFPESEEVTVTNDTQQAKYNAVKNKHKWLRWALTVTHFGDDMKDPMTVPSQDYHVHDHARRFALDLTT
jgi:hypothetical protein